MINEKNYLRFPMKEEELYHHTKGLMQTATGYGKKLATPYKVYIHGRWYRIYNCQFSNCGTAYITVNGEDFNVWGIDREDKEVTFQRKDVIAIQRLFKDTFKRKFNDWTVEIKYEERIDMFTVTIFNEWSDCKFDWGGIYPNNPERYFSFHNKDWCEGLKPQIFFLHNCKTPKRLNDWVRKVAVDNFILFSSDYRTDEASV